MATKVLLLGANNPETPRMLHRVREQAGMEFAGYIDNDPAKKGRDFYGLPVFGGFEILSRFDPTQFAFVNLISGDCVTRHQTTQVMRAAGFAMINLIHPSIDLYMVRTGRGIYLREGVVVQAEVTLEDNVCMHIGALIGHETYVGESTFIAPGASVCGCVRIGRGVFVGAGATILPRLKIGDWAVIGAGAVVTSDVPAQTVVIGNPARFMRKRELPDGWAGQ